jgi:uncharacterized protein DUF1153
MEHDNSQPSYVIGPRGFVLTIADLPSPQKTRWVIRRKAEVVAAVRGGLLSLEDVCERYSLTVEEFLSWQHASEHSRSSRVLTSTDHQERDARGMPA